VTLFLANARLVDPEAGTVTLGGVDVTDGRIARIVRNGEDVVAAETVDCDGKALAPGIVDLGVKVCEPGASR